jgi:hypothetical protein
MSATYEDWGHAPAYTPANSPKTIEQLDILSRLALQDLAGARWNADSDFTTDEHMVLADLIRLGLVKRNAEASAYGLTPAGFWAPDSLTAA